MRFFRTRRIIVTGAVAAAAFLPLAVSNATPAAAYCGPQAVEGGNGCSNPCNDGLEKLARKAGQELNCIQ